MRERSEQEKHDIAEAHRKLRLIEDRYFKMVDDVQDYAIILLDENGIIQNLNKGAQKIKLYHEKEIVGKHFSVLYLPEDRESNLPETLLKEAKEKGSAKHEGWRLRKGGSKFWGSITLTALHGEEGEIIGYSKVTRDLTDKKLAEDQLKQHATDLQALNEALRTSEERYHKMVEEVQDYAIIFLDADGIIQNWNKGAQKIKQYKDWEAIGHHFRMFYLPEDRLGKLPEILLEQARIHERAVHEGWRMRKDGSRFWGSISLTALHNNNNELIGFSKVTRDLTEKKLAEDQLKDFAAELQLSNEQLRKSEERYHKMISEVQDYAIILLDVHGNIQNWNLGAQKIKGYTADEIIGKNFEIFYTEEDRLRQLPQQLLEEAAKNGKATHEGWRVTKQGNKFWGSIVITALHDDNGSIIGYSKVTRDLTIRKQADDKLEEFLLELQRQNEELDQFAYTASHDLQEPLRKIRMFADLVEENLDNKETAAKFLEKINRASQRMLEMIGAVLEYSRLSKNVDQKTDTDLNQVLNEVIGDFELIIKQKNATVQLDQLPVIKANPLLANQLFMNLIGNALKYSKENPVISISSSIVSDKTQKHSACNLPTGNYHELIFSDNGIGFEPEYANLIFSLFQRLHGKHEYNGTGIGLALCKKIMENHGGYIYAVGNPGKGASFYLYFPTKLSP